MKKIQSIQCLRGVAALLVVIRHCWGGPEIASLGVDLFFVISGFIMVYTSRHDFGQVKSSLRFLVRRTLRIIPAYWFSTFLIVLIVGRPTYTHLFKSLFLVAEDVTALNAPAWTLMYEMFFYLLFALLLPFRQRYAIPLLLLSLVVFSVLGTYSTDPYIAYYGRSLIIEFGMGAIIGIVYNHGLSIGSRSSLIGLAVSILILLVSLKFNVNGANWQRLMLWGCPAALIVFTTVTGPAYPWMEFGLAGQLGDASYSIYITHWIWFITYAGQAPLLATLNSLIFGIGFYSCIEKPLNNLFRAALSQDRQRLTRFLGFAAEAAAPPRRRGSLWAAVRAGGRLPARVAGTSNG